jgi:Transcription termination factor nusG
MAAHVVEPVIPGWFLLRVRLRTELAVGKKLRAKGYEVFVPVRTVRKQWSDRIKVYDVPIFPCAVFCRARRELWQDIYGTDGVFTIEKIGNEPVYVPDDELAAVRCLADSNFDLELSDLCVSGEDATVLTDAGPLPCVVLESGEVCRIAVRCKTLNPLFSARVLEARVPRTRIRRLSEDSCHR